MSAGAGSAHPGDGSPARTWPALGVGGLGSVDAEVPDLLHAVLADYEIAAIDESAPEGWRVFFQTDAERDRAAGDLTARFPHLTVLPVDVADEDWAARSQASLHAVRVGAIIVAPPWDVPTTIVIQPSMGFGTGHHATTRLCLAALQRIEVAGRTVLDVGTGSGVLAIAASRLGADATGIDDDRDAIQAAWENLALNPAAVVTLIVGDFRTVELVPAGIVLANLTGGLLMAAAARLRALTAAHGRMILSGFMAHEERAVLAAFAGFSVEHRAEEDEWLCVTLTDGP
jgi:ribosomal protein L11 methyltransferase